MIWQFALRYFRARKSTSAINLIAWVSVGAIAVGTAALITVLSQLAQVGDQMGGRVGYFLHTDDFRRDHAAMSAQGVKFVEAPRYEPYGTVVVFEDLYGNRWDMIEPKR